MENTNEMQLIFDSRSSNESFARVTVAAFMTSLNPTVEEVSDVKTAVSEAVTNAIIHGYESEVHNIYIRCRTEGKTLYLEIEDEGKGIEDVSRPWSRFLPRSRNWSGREWDSLSWKPLWINWKLNQSRAKEQR